MLHPAACLLIWIIFALIVQYLGWWGLLFCLLILCIPGRAVRVRCLLLVRRARWLLLSLWLILAYGTPGDLWMGQTWMPSLEGLDVASLHAARLVALLGSLAWLLHTLKHDGLVISLWVLARPLRFLGVNADQTVARLALVFDYLDHAPPRGTWRNFLDFPPEGDRILECVSLDLPAWRLADTGALLAASLTFGLLLVFAL